jgi:eukaryotic-like serine/threonine-protein kinase
MIGAILQDRYRLDAELGRGGMGVVYRAHDTLLARDVAVKLLNLSVPGSEGSAVRARFLREAQAAARLSHPHIVAVYDAGETFLPETTSPLPFIVMELIAGKPLPDLLPIPLEAGLEIVRQICAALVEAHAAGIIHRDLKSANVLLTPNKTAKLVDFGLAHVSAASQLTVEGAIMGTVAYMAPELIQGQPATFASDLYAFGVLLYEVAAGRQPFVAEHLAALFSQHLYAPVVPPSTYQDKIPPALDRLILRLLSKQPADRPASASDVLQTLENLASPELVPQPELPLLDRIARGRLVARAEETAVANRLWQQAMKGDGQTLLISGEPGIGKTRLVQELKVQAEINRARSLWAECYAEGSAPYAPIMQILTQIFQNGALAAVDLPEYAANGLLTIAPALQPLFPDLSPTRLQEPQAEQQRLLDSVLALLTLLAEQTPLLLVVDDAHWADSAGLNLLRYLARRGRGLRLLLVLTYREVELNEARALHELLFDLQRERLATRLKLNRLTLAQTGELLATLFTEEITPEFLQGIYRETEGNPFFVEEVCKALIESGQLSRQDGRWRRPSDMADMRIPQSVRLAIESRLVRLPASVQEVLRLAAVFGRKFEFDLLCQVADLDEDDLIEALEQAERAQLIREVSAGGGGLFSFAHALIPTALVEGLSGLRRRRLHRRVAAVIEDRNPHDYEALAHHYAAAADEERAILYYGRAGERALVVCANEDAERHYRAALEFEPEPRARAAGLAGLAEAVTRQSHPASAIALFEEAIQLYQSLPDSDQVARLYARLARVILDYEGRPASLAVCRHGLAAVAGQPETPGLAALLAETARACWADGLLEEAGSLFDQALALAERFSLVAVQAELLASAFAMPALSPAERVAAAQKAIKLAEEAGLLETAARAYHNLGFYYALMDDMESYCRHLWSALELARRLGSAALELRHMTLLIEGLCSLGRIDEAEGLATQMQALLDEHPDLGEATTAPARLEIALFARYCGDLATFIEVALVERNRLGDIQHSIFYDTQLGDALLEVGRLDEAREILAEAMAAAERMQMIPSAHYLMSILLARQGNLAEAHALLAGVAEASLATTAPDQVLALWAGASLSLAEGNRPAAWQGYEAAVNQAAALKLRWYQAYMMLEWAGALANQAETSDRELARDLLAQAEALFTEMNVPYYGRLAWEKLATLI